MLTQLVVSQYFGFFTFLFFKELGKKNKGYPFYFEKLFVQPYWLKWNCVFSTTSVEILFVQFVCMRINEFVLYMICYMLMHVSWFVLIPSLDAYVQVLPFLSLCGDLQLFSEPIVSDICLERQKLIIHYLVLLTSSRMCYNWVTSHKHCQLQSFIYTEDFPAFSAGDGRNGMQLNSENEIQQDVSPYWFSEKENLLVSISSSSRGAIDLASVVRLHPGILVFGSMVEMVLQMLVSTLVELSCFSWIWQWRARIGPNGDKVQGRIPAREAPVCLETGELFIRRGLLFLAAIDAYI